VEFPRQEYIVGEIVAVYTEEKYLTEGRPDIRKINPLIFENSPGYWRLEGYITKAFEIGKTYQRKPK
jgi:hypothetical protein